MNSNNPYAPTTGENQPSQQPAIALDPIDEKKVNAVIKDAGQFWLAIILCLLCSAIGALIIPIWYSVRLLQWQGLSKKYPLLVQAGAPAGSVPAKFQSSQWKLIVGIVFGAIIFAFVALVVVLNVLVLQAGPPPGI